MYIYSSKKKKVYVWFLRKNLIIFWRLRSLSLLYLPCSYVHKVEITAPLAPGSPEKWNRMSEAKITLLRGAFPRTSVGRTWSDKPNVRRPCLICFLWTGELKTGPTASRRQEQCRQLRSQGASAGTVGRQGLLCIFWIFLRPLKPLTVTWNHNKRQLWQWLAVRLSLTTRIGQWKGTMAIKGNHRKYTWRTDGARGRQAAPGPPDAHGPTPCRKKCRNRAENSTMHYWTVPSKRSHNQSVRGDTGCRE